MTTCKGCGLKNLEWLNVNNRWILYDENGNPHKCGKFVKPDIQQNRSVCKHRILLTSWCNLCEEERR